MNGKTGKKPFLAKFRKPIWTLSIFSVTFTIPTWILDSLEMPSPLISTFEDPLVTLRKPMLVPSAFFCMTLMKPAAAGFINVIQKNAEGTNMGFLNVTSGSSNVDISGLGISKESKIQVGIVNVTEKIESVQIGFLNFAKNGFFPVFPFINFPKSE